MTRAQEGRARASSRVAATRVHHEAAWLVDDDEVRILVQDVEDDAGVGLETRSSRAAAGSTSTTAPRSRRPTRTPAARHRHASRPNPALDRRSRCGIALLGHALDHELVEPIERMPRAATKRWAFAGSRFTGRHCAGARAEGANGYQSFDFTCPFDLIKMSMRARS